MNPATQMTHHAPQKMGTARNYVGPQSVEKRRLLTTERPSMFVKNGKLLIGAARTGRDGHGQPNQYSIEAQKMREQEAMMEQMLTTQRGISGV